MKKREKKEKSGRKIEFFMVLIILALLASLLLLIYKGFTVKQVEVEGTELYSDETIRQWVLNDDYSWNTMYVFLKYRFQDAEEMAFLQQPVVTIKNPHVLHIRVEEKQMAGYLYIPAVGQNAYFDKDGIVVETSSEKLDGLMEITGLDCEKVTLGKKIPVQNKSMLKAMLGLTQGLEKYAMMPKAIRCDEFSNIMLVYEDMTVNFGNSRNMTEKLEALSVIFPQVKDLKGTLHMENWSEENTDVPFEKNDGS